MGQGSGRPGGGGRFQACSSGDKQVDLITYSRPREGGGRSSFPDSNKSCTPVDTDRPQLRLRGYPMPRMSFIRPIFSSLGWMSGANFTQQSQGGGPFRRANPAGPVGNVALMARLACPLRRDRGRSRERKFFRNGVFPGRCAGLAAERRDEAECVPGSEGLESCADFLSAFPGDGGLLSRWNFLPARSCPTAKSLRMTRRHSGCLWRGICCGSRMTGRVAGNEELTSVRRPGLALRK